VQTHITIIIVIVIIICVLLLAGSFEPGDYIAMFLGPALTGTCTMALDPTYGSFTLLEPVSLVKVFRLFRSERIFLVFKEWTQYFDAQHLIYWQGQHVCDALFWFSVQPCY
jgi:hypothetical protein